MAKVEVTMPQMGESITEGTVIAWHKQPGDTVELDETLLEIGTDKVDTEVPSPAAGVLQEILVPEDETVDVGTVIAILETDVEAGGDTAPAEAPPAPAAAPEPVAAPAPPPAAVPPTPAAPPAPTAAPSAMPAADDVPVVMPKMGESITEGTVLVWHKQVGDTIDMDETLLEIGTDKVDTEVPSPAAGVVKAILAEEGDTVEVGTPIAVIGSSMGAVATPAPVATPAAPAAAPQPTPAVPAGPL